MIRSLAVALTLISLGIAGAGSAQAQDTITLRLADSLPHGHAIHEAVAKPFMEAVTKATNGRVQFQHFPAEQLGKARDLLALTQTGVADISYIVPSYTSDKTPLTAVAELPGAFQSQCQGSMAVYVLSHGGILEEKEFKPNRIRPLITVALPAYQLLLSSPRTVTTANDLHGLKVRTAGGAMDLMVRSIGAVPVRMAAPEIWESMSRGTLDGAVLSYQSVTSYDLNKLIKSGTVGLNFGTAVITYSIGEAKWQSLPQDVRNILAEAGEMATREGCKRLEAVERTATEKVRAAGMKEISFGETDRAAFAKAFDTVAEDWAKELDKRGKPGTEVAKAFRAALESAR
ncbi:MAG TPA: TRAP transporter substrate-binding protein DctP [Microvirga sp.]|nr:TRAP transporter substrate-binding protein DctP [Microvirga sp.]